MSSVIQRLGMGDEKRVIQLLVSLNNLTSHCFQLLELIYCRVRIGCSVSDLQIQDITFMFMEWNNHVSHSVSVVVKHC